MRKNIKVYIVSIVIALAVGGLAAFFTRNNMSIYYSINQPTLAPPMILFPIVWSVLYIFMGIGSAIVYIKRKENPTEAYCGLRIYGLQLTVNFLWSIIFFNLQAYLFAFIWLLALVGLIVGMIFQFRTISKTASNFQIPYLLWVVFAGYLNLMVYILNGAN